MKPVVTLTAPIAQVRHLPPVPVSDIMAHGRPWDCWVATVGVGYADGWRVAAVVKQWPKTWATCSLSWPYQHDNGHPNWDTQPEVGDTVTLLVKVRH